jgi:hypothetical protein
MGRKYSLFAAECMKAYFEPVVTRKIEYSITDNCVAITVEGGTPLDRQQIHSPLDIYNQLD